MSHIDLMMGTQKYRMSTFRFNARDHTFIYQKYPELYVHPFTRIIQKRLRQNALVQSSKNLGFYGYFKHTGMHWWDWCNAPNFSSSLNMRKNIIKKSTFFLLGNNKKLTSFLLTIGSSRSTNTHRIGVLFETNYFLRLFQRTGSM